MSRRSVRQRRSTHSNVIRLFASFSDAANAATPDAPTALAAIDAPKRPIASRPEQHVAGPQGPATGPTRPVPMRPVAIRCAAVTAADQPWMEGMAAATPLLCPRPVLAVAPFELPLGWFGGVRCTRGEGEGIGSGGGGPMGGVIAMMGGRMTPPPHLISGDVSAAALLLGSPVGGMAAAGTLLQMLMTGALGVEGAHTTAGKQCNSFVTVAVTKKKRTATDSAAAKQHRHWGAQGPAVAVAGVEKAPHWSAVASSALHNQSTVSEEEGKVKKPKSSLAPINQPPKKRKAFELAGYESVGCRVPSSEVNPEPYTVNPMP